MRLVGDLANEVKEWRISDPCVTLSKRQMVTLSKTDEAENDSNCYEGDKQRIAVLRLFGYSLHHLAGFFPVPDSLQPIPNAF